MIPDHSPFTLALNRVLVDVGLLIQAAYQEAKAETVYLDLSDQEIVVLIAQPWDLRPLFRAFPSLDIIPSGNGDHSVRFWIGRSEDHEDLTTDEG